MSILNVNKINPVGGGSTVTIAGIASVTGSITGNGSGLTTLNASNLASGTVPSARLGSGTASSSTFLRGDSTFAAVTSTTINNNADNRVITGSGTANTLEGEANLTWDGNDLEPSRSTFRVSAAGNHQLIYNLSVAIEVNASSVDIPKARIGPWTTAKTLSWTAREYTSSFEGSLHTTNHWDGTGTDQFICPMLKVTAIA